MRTDTVPQSFSALLVSISKVRYISSIGIPLLINTAKSVVSHGVKMVLLNPQDRVFQVMELVGVPQMVLMHADKDSAVAELTECSTNRNKNGLTKLSVRPIGV